VVEQRGEEVFFGLSEKGPSIEHWVRPNASPAARSIFDTGNLMKPWSELAFGDWRGVWALFGPRQRMQLGLSDSNVAQVAELLKIATTHLVLEMAEEGALDQAPQLADPVGALHALIQDPTLTASVPDTHGHRWSALDLQRFYLTRAQQWLKQHPAPSLQHREVVRLWAETLDALAQDPSRLIGCLDWVTKRALVENCSDEGDLFAVRKKLDLKYHELGVGYLAQLEAQGLAPRVLDEEDIARAQREPPNNSPALLRGQWIREASPLAHDLRVTWDSVRVGGRFRGRVVRLADWRPKS
jgi:proteasome accessory factor A